MTRRVEIIVHPCTTKSNEQFESLSRDSIAAARTSEVFHAHGQHQLCVCLTRADGGIAHALCLTSSMKTFSMFNRSTVVLFNYTGASDRLVSANADTLKT